MPMKRSGFFIYTMVALLFSSCGGRSKASFALTAGDTIPLRYADNLTLVTYSDYTVATLRNPWDTLKTLHTYILVPSSQSLPAHLPEGTIVRTPLRKSVIYSSVHCSLMESLGVTGSIGGVCDLKYIKLPSIQDGCSKGTIIDCGDGMNPDMNIPIIECADYMETSALGRAEWMRFYGLLFGVASEADSLFAEVDSCYGRLKKRAALSSVSLSIVSELKSGSAWYVPGGRSTIGRLFNDACGRYVFSEDKHSGSIPLAFETVFDKAGDADVWTIKYNRDRDMTYADLKAFKTRNIYGCNTAKVPFYEETPFRPDYLLADLIQILHPEIGDLGGLRYFCKLNE